MLPERRVTIVTGAGAGIGAAIALHLASEGAIVVVADVDAVAGEATAAQIVSGGGKASFHRTDITSPGSVDALIDFTLTEHGRLDSAVNNAGFHEAPALMHELAIDEWRRVIDVNLTGTWLCMRAELAHFTKTGAGAIVNIASAAGLKAAPRGSAYSASKHGVIGLTRTGAVDYVRQGIRVNAVAPGAIDTPALARFGDEQLRAWKAAMPMGRLGTTGEAASAVAWLLSDQASYVTGIVLEVDGGYSQT